MRIFEFERSTVVPASIEETFTFFSDAFNLETITPPFLSFSVTTPAPIDIREGCTIDYRLKLRGLPIRWRSLISAWDPPHRFVDEQLKGPYRMWHHEHTFAQHDEGTLVGDHVRYAVLGGALVNRLFVRRDVEGIFDYREAKLREIFGGRTATRHAAHR